ncbi:excisionase family DNA binding protein [Saccharomonospora amisosensis]|uniref:Excisionase family DNA binding protein n=1 Tax=Saccharomonospora amisosensis TaxID=1128677 RepID=A0A7X5ZNP8_9PSEU|nr:helix-turn-helix domain-containing protein [Saccharomonospora amisosensis]NIJ09897.1 excisionase family DNA binding protein [Saccharomonospora amisosensis]
MQFEPNRMYRVKAVAEALDVSATTIYRAIEAGKLDALKLGKATLRVTGAAANAYVNACSEAAYQSYVVEGASAADAEGEQAGEVA